MTDQIIGRDPIAKTIVEAFDAHHPDWTDEQICERINRDYDKPVITIEEVVQWRAGVAT